MGCCPCPDPTLNLIRNPDFKPDNPTVLNSIIQEWEYELPGRTITTFNPAVSFQQWVMPVAAFVTVAGRGYQNFLEGGAYGFRQKNVLVPGCDYQFVLNWFGGTKPIGATQKLYIYSETGYVYGIFEYPPVAFSGSETFYFTAQGYNLQFQTVIDYPQNGYAPAYNFELYCSNLAANCQPCELELPTFANCCYQTAVGGIDKVYVGLANQLQRVYFDSMHQVSEFVPATGLNSINMVEWLFDRDKTQYTQDWTRDKTGRYYAHSLAVKQSKLAPDMQQAISRFIDRQLFFLLKDRNSQWLVVGYDTGLRLVSRQATPGASFADYNGWALNFAGKSRCPLRFVSDAGLATLALQDVCITSSPLPFGCAAPIDTQCADTLSIYCNAPIF